MFRNGNQHSAYIALWDVRGARTMLSESSFGTAVKGRADDALEEVDARHPLDACRFAPERAVEPSSPCDLPVVRCVRRPSASSASVKILNKSNNWQQRERLRRNNQRQQSSQMTLDGVIQ